MEESELGKAAGQYSARMSLLRDPIFWPSISIDFTAGANWQKERENAELTRAQADYEYWREATLKNLRELEDENERANARIEELTKALKDLCDLQNGPPLPTYEKDFNEVMERCDKLLEK